MTECWSIDHQISSVLFSRSRRHLNKECQFGFSAEAVEEQTDLDPTITYYQLDNSSDAPFPPLSVRKSTGTGWSRKAWTLSRNWSVAVYYLIFSLLIVMKLIKLNDLKQSVNEDFDPPSGSDCGITLHHDSPAPYIWHLLQGSEGLRAPPPCASTWKHPHLFVRGGPGGHEHCWGPGWEGKLFC